MSWLASIAIAVLTGGLGLLVAGYIAERCGDWYHVSNVDGGAVALVVAAALLGGMASAVIGLVVSRFVPGGGVVGFLQGLGASSGMVVVIGGVSILIAWLLADIPPRIAGVLLDLDVEIKLPVGETVPSVSDTDKPSLTLGSIVNHVQRKSGRGTLKVDEARLEDGRWIVPGSVMVFTTRGLRMIDARIGQKSIGAFMVPLPARPGTEFEQWSPWTPRPRAGDPPWPDSKASYRFRIRRVPHEPPPDPAVVKAERFAALAPDAPLPDWLGFLHHDGPPERNAAVMKVVGERQAELATLIRSTDDGTRQAALSGAERLVNVAPDVLEAVLAEGRNITAEIRRFNEMPADAEHFYDVQVQLRSRFGSWKGAWWNIHRRLGIDGRPPVQEIHDAALVRSPDTSMSEIVVNARAILDVLPPSPGKTS